MNKPNAEQQAVIDDFENNIILFASAGTGKTFTVANKVKAIIERGLALPRQILCLTFTIKACDEMSQDIGKYNEEAKGVSVKTIHGFCFDVIKEEAKLNLNAYVEPSICDEVDQEELLQKLIEVTLSQTKFKIHKFREIVSVIKRSREKLGFFSVDAATDYQRTFGYLMANSDKALINALSYYAGGNKRLLDDNFVSAFSPYAGKIICAYDTLLRQSNKVDFDDLILQTLHIFKNENSLQRWRSKFKYIIVDEMQDTSETEYSVLKNLFDGNKVLLCGDISQTIYEWRGSKPFTILQKFEEEFSARTYMLSVNYRSTKTLVNASFGYLKEANPQIFGKYCPKEIEADAVDAGNPIRYVTLQNEDAQAKFIFKYFKKHPIEDPSKVCIMSRTNAYIAKLYEKLEGINVNLPYNERIRFFTVDADYRFYKKPVIKDVLAFWSVLLNGQDAVSLERIAERYVSGIGRAALAAIRGNSAGVNITAFLEEDSYIHSDNYYSLVNAHGSGNVVVYDIETTGLDLERDEIIQLAAIRIDGGGRVTEKFNRIVLPNVEISEGALNTHGFSAEFVKQNGISAKAALEEFSRFVKGAVIVGHNSSKFDSAIVSRQLKECGLPALDIIGEYDTLVLSKIFCPNSENFKLETLCNRFGVVNERAHDAFYDVLATAQILTCLIAQKIKPATLDRAEIIDKFKDKFSAFYKSYKEMYGLLLAGNAEKLNEYITANFDILGVNGTKSAEADLEDLNELVKSNAPRYADAKSLLYNLLNEAALSGSQMDILIKKLNKIPIITVHQSKGCEFNTVILAGVDGVNFPADSGNAAEEARVFYVAVTRAKRELIITYHKYGTSRWGNGYERQPCAFVELIPREYVERYELT